MTQNYIKTRVRLPNNNESNLFAYVPVAGYTDPGIVAFNENQFSINNDTHIVTLNTNFTGQYYTKPEVNTLLSEKVEKTDQSLKLYGTDDTGAQTTYTLSRSQNDTDSVPWRYQGRLPGINDPVNSLDAANKHYIDNNFASLSGNNTFTGYNSFQNVDITFGSLNVINTDGVYLRIGDSGFDNVCLYGDVIVMNSISWESAPVDDYNLTNKYYVDTGLSAKVNKLSDLEAPAVYIGNPNGTQTYRYLDNLALGDSIPLRDSNGNIYVGDSRNTGHAASIGYVNTAIAEQIGRVYKPAGSITFAELINTVDLDESNLGNIYNIRNAFTTTSDFMEGAGKDYPAGTNVGVVQDGANYYFDVFVGQVDLSNYYTKTEVNSLLLGYVKKDAESNILYGNLEVQGYIQVYSSLVNADGYEYLNEVDYATPEEMGEILAVLS